MTSPESLQLQVKEVTTIMKKNLEKVLDRDDTLLNLEEKSQNLKENSTKFETTARKLKRKMWWKNIKFMIILISIILILILILTLIIWSRTK
jgi:hypothetical protein